MTTIKETKEIITSALLSITGVVGVGIGAGNDKYEIVISVERLTPELEREIPKRIGGYNVRIVETGKFYALQTVSVTPAIISPLAIDRTARHRPYFGGISISHPKVTAGTLSCRVFDTETGKKLILSNNHVIANSDYDDAERASVGDSILQPGVYDGGKEENDKVGELYNWKKLSTTEDNYVDAAVALPDNEAEFSDSIADIDGVYDTKEPEIEEEVLKSGRTTAVTKGKIIAVDQTVKVTYSTIGKELSFKDQVLIEGIDDTFVAGGDSGSLLISEDYKAIGLIFAGAGSGKYGIANRISNVCSLLSVQFPETPPVEVYGAVVDAETGVGLRATVIYDDIKKETDEEGKFYVGLTAAGGEYTFKVFSLDYTAARIKVICEEGKNYLLISLAKIPEVPVVTIIGTTMGLIGLMVSSFSLIRL